MNSENTQIKSHQKKFYSNPMYCNTCHYNFQNSKLYYDHLSVSSIRQCKICKINFSSLCVLNSHSKKHSILNQKRNNKISQMKLKLDKKPISKNLFICKVCGRSFQHRSSFRAHEPTHTGVKPFQCNICQKSFALQWNLVSHLHTHTGVRRYKCHKCNSMFARSTTLREHMQVHLPMSEKPICRCEECGKVFRSKKSLSGHKIVHSKTRPFVCDICERGFVSRRNLRNHQKIHLNGRLFRCDACDLFFRTSINLAIHRSDKHFSPEYTNFPKIISELAFKIENNASEHLLYPCDKCSTNYEEKQIWVQHMQRHFIDQYRCICYNCGKPNANLEDLREHLKVHSDGIPPPPSSPPPKIGLSNYDIKYFISFFATNGIDVVVKETEKNRCSYFSESENEIPPPPRDLERNDVKFKEEKVEKILERSARCFKE